MLGSRLGMGHQTILHTGIMKLEQAWEGVHYSPQRRPTLNDLSTNNVGKKEHWFCSVSALIISCSLFNTNESQNIETYRDTETPSQRYLANHKAKQSIHKLFFFLYELERLCHSTYIMGPKSAKLYCIHTRSLWAPLQYSRLSSSNVAESRKTLSRVYTCYQLLTLPIHVCTFNCKMLLFLSATGKYPASLGRSS